MNHQKNRNMWLDFYNDIKASEWPDCYNEHEYKSLPDSIKEEIINLYDGSIYVHISEQNIIVNDKDILTFNKVDDSQPFADDYSGEIICKERFFVAKDFYVMYEKYMDGNGIYHSQIYPRVINFLYPNKKFQNCLEWCSGPGFIGYRLMSDGLCQNISFMDKYLPSLTAVKNTYLNRPSRLTDCKIHTLWNDNIESIGTNQYDLIVANPPNFANFCYNHFYQSSNLQKRISQDVNWQIHKEFFCNISKNLTDDGKILLMKHIDGSQPIDHIDSIDKGNLKVLKIFRTTIAPNFYFIEIAKK